jgi:hypothetical protein
VEKNPLICIMSNQLFGQEPVGRRFANKFLKFYMHTVEDAQYVSALYSAINVKILKLEDTK